MKKFLLFSIILVLAAVLRASAQYSSIVVFGDSLSDYGNAGTFTTTPTSKPTSHIVGVWVKQLADRLNLPLSASKSGGTDYAVGGATTSGGGSSIANQVKTYLAANPSASPAALYIFQGGGNDILYRAKKNPMDGAGLATTAANAVNNIKSEIAEVAGAGGKTFVWLNMFPIEKTPIGSMLAPELKGPVDQFNTLWSHALDDLKTRFPNTTFIGVNFHDSTNDAIANPAKYGFANVTDSAKGQPVNPDTYLFWDYIHPTTRGHQILADFVFKLLPQTGADPAAVLLKTAP